MCKISLLKENRSQNLSLSLKGESFFPTNRKGVSNGDVFPTILIPIYVAKVGFLLYECAQLAKPKQQTSMVVEVF